MDKVTYMWWDGAKGWFMLSLRYASVDKEEKGNLSRLPRKLKLVRFITVMLSP